MWRLCQWAYQVVLVLHPCMVAITAVGSWLLLLLLVLFWFATRSATSPAGIGRSASIPPVITTFWSGPTAYLTEDNGYPLRIDGLVPLPEDSPFKGHKWAQPSVTHLSALMRHVVTNPKARHAWRRRDWQHTVHHRRRRTRVGGRGRRWWAISRHITWRRRWRHGLVPYLQRCDEAGTDMRGCEAVYSFLDSNTSRKLS